MGQLHGLDGCVQLDFSPAPFDKGETGKILDSTIFAVFEKLMAKKGSLTALFVPFWLTRGSFRAFFPSIF